MIERRKVRRAAVLIPAYEPDQSLADVVRDTLAALPHDIPIVVVDDGSRSERAARAFEAVGRYPRVHLLRHAENGGKGAALKTGIGYALDALGAEVVVTADADGQHLPRDIVRMARVATRLRARTALLVGVRAFPYRGTPLRSWFGNRVTRALFALFAGQYLADTQSGLRAIPLPLLRDCLEIAPDGYEFEFEMLFRARRVGRIAQMRIARVYEPGNPSSHFNPLRDSARIYAVLLRQWRLSRRLAAG